MTLHSEMVSGDRLANCEAVDQRYSDSHLTGAQKILYKLLSGLTDGCLIIRDHNWHETVFGKPSSQHPYVKCLVHNPEFFSRLLKGGSLALGESYMDRWWDVEEDRLVDLFKLLFANRFEFCFKGNLVRRISFLVERIRSRSSSLPVAKRNIESHYDLGNEFFTLMLDSSMTYSCAYQRRADDSLATMQEQKYERIYDKLGLARGGELVDIGCGWGGMLLYAARRNPAIRGTGVTLSAEQYQYASAQISKAGLADRLSVKLSDYREMMGSYDFLLSIGMFEHVGKESYKIFFDKMAQLLKPGGIGLLHTIGLEEDPSFPGDPWIAKYLFPGSRLPRLEELVKGMREHACTIGHIENWRPHYALTLDRWRENFVRNWLEISRLGFDERFYRMWCYYLQICEACFCDSTIELYQILFCKGRRWTFPLQFDFAHH